MVIRLVAIAAVLALVWAPGVAFSQSTASEAGTAASAFLRAWDQSRDLPTVDRVAAIQSAVGPLAPAFYDPRRLGPTGQERQAAMMAAAIEDFAQIREVYIRKLEGFEAALGDNLATFRVAFPDFEPGDRVLVVHSLGELDGGVLTLNGRQTLVFGIDVMAAHHPFESESAFFHHELFHLYHSDDFGCAAVWCTLWSEGLATYVAHRLNPTATDAELLLDLPKGVVADTIAVEALAWERLEATLLSTDTADRAVLFQARPSPGGLPPRHGYYLGYRIVEELGQTRDLHALAALTPEEVLPLIQATVTEFRRGRASDRPEH